MTVTDMPDKARGNAAARKAIITFGMHRSGTSAVTRLFSALGADLPSNLLPPQKDNPLGFWESEDIVKLHNRLLLSAGSSWHDPLPLRDDWFASENARRFEDELLILLENNFAESDLFVIKDPRICKLVPLWRSVLRRFESVPHFVITLRNPLEVAESLVQRDGFSRHKGVLLWLMHALHAERETRNDLRAVVSYEALLEDWQRVVSGVSNQLSIAFPKNVGEAADEVQGFLLNEMRHHEFSAQDLKRLGDIGKWSNVVYRELVKFSNDGHALDTSILDRVHGDIEQEFGSMRPILEDQGRRIADAEARLETLTAAAASAREEADGLRVALERERAAAHEAIEAYRGEAERLRGEITAQVAAIHSTLSWRITAPLRFAKLQLRRLSLGVAGLGATAIVGTSQAARVVFHRLPIPPAAKNRLRSRLRPLFRWLSDMGLRPGGRLADPDQFPELERPFALRVTRPETVGVKDLEFPRHASPLVSIIVPAYNQISYTLNCLRAIQETQTGIPFEVIVVDDCSQDDTEVLLQNIPGVRLLRNSENLGFVKSCNRGAEAATGKYLVFLNNDTSVQEGWLQELVGTVEEEPGAGVVGSQLINADGTLQEAGGLIWSDGSGWNLGRGSDRRRPEFNHLRDTSYCSGASLLIPKRLFEDVGGFDETFAPAYYEDTDLAFKVRERGHRVLFQPLSRVVHFEGISCGTSVTAGVKQYQLRNQRLFRDKWASVLRSLPAGPEDLGQPDPTCKYRLLIIDSYTPMPDRDSGSVDAFFLMKELRSLSFGITFIPDNLLFTEEYTPDLQRFGVECLYRPYVDDVLNFISKRGKDYDFVLLTRCYVADKYIDAVRERCTDARIGFIVVDLHYLRQEREAAIHQSRRLRKEAALVKQQECAVIRKSDLTILKSEEERNVLADELQDARTFVLPLIIDNPNRQEVPFEKREHFFFVGSYQHPPNVDAVLYFVNSVWPMVSARLPDARVFIIGGDMPAKIRDLEVNGIEIVGHVKELTTFMSSCRVMVAPLRYGAGVKGKVGRSLGYGVPCVATSIAVEGMGLVDGEEVIVADGEAVFAKRCVDLYTDKALWDRISNKGLAFFEREISLAAGRKSIRDMMRELGADL